MIAHEILIGTIKPLIIKLINKEGRMYGYQITQKVKELSSGKIVITEGALYPALHKLVAEGVMITESEWIGNRERKYYLLSERGKMEVVSRLNEIRESIRLFARLFDLEYLPYEIE
jgi:DNA-binding PadR family transcriptional regulator